MKKIIIVDSCKECPYVVKDNSQNYCVVNYINITKWIKSDKISPSCELDNAIVERKIVRDRNVIISEGIARCLRNMDSSEESIKYSVKHEYSFKRQIDGNVRVYPMGYTENDDSYYELCEDRVFQRFFKVVDEKSVNIKEANVCSKCERPIKWCECL